MAEKNTNTTTGLRHFGPRPWQQRLVPAASHAEQTLVNRERDLSGLALVNSLAERCSPARKEPHPTGMANRVPECGLLRLAPRPKRRILHTGHTRPYHRLL